MFKNFVTTYIKQEYAPQVYKQLFLNTRFTRFFKGNQMVWEYGPRESNAYFGYRFPTAYGVLSGLFSQIKKRGMKAPESILDFGCGPGTALAAEEVWDGALLTGIGIDHSTDMIGIAKQIAGLLFCFKRDCEYYFKS
ncbi:hypothetical protein HK096_009294 [Nowakowskiella sp. JEL0078]|nr:hypothetical protein HK096_009294 [Nowakowskiella sp. JEL0078]